MADTTIMSLEDLDALAETPPIDGLPTAPAVPAAPAAPAEPVVNPQVDALRQALAISEAARADVMRMQHAQQQAQTQSANTPRWFNDAELLEMHSSDDPQVRFQASRIEAQQQLARGAQLFEQRFAQLASSVHTTAEADAARRYPKEFELFGQQIKQLASQTDPALLTSTATWDNLIGYVRGAPGNFEKLVAAQTTLSPTLAREAQAASVGASFASTPQFSQQQHPLAVDPVTREIALGLGYDTVDAYLKDMKLTERFAL